MLVMSDLISELRAKSNKNPQPTMEILVGTNEIRIPLKPRLGDEQPRLQASAGSSGPSEEFLQGPFTVMFTADLNLMPDVDDTHTLIACINSIDKLVGLELTGLYISQSTLLAFLAPWSFWGKIQGFDIFTLVGEVFGTNLLPPRPAISPEMHLPSAKPSRSTNNPAASDRDTDQHHKKSKWTTLTRARSRSLNAMMMKARVERKSLALLEPIY